MHHCLRWVYGELRRFVLADDGKQRPRVRPISADDNVHVLGLGTFLREILAMCKQLEQRLVFG